MNINGARLTQLREKNGLSQRELAERTGIALSTINKWETVPTANPFPSKLKRVADVLRVDLEALVGEDTPAHVETVPQSIPLSTPRDFLKCVRRELRAENAFTQDGLLGLLQYKGSPSTKDPDAMYEYNPKTRQYEGETKTAEVFQRIYGNIEDSSDTIFNCYSLFRMFFRSRSTRWELNAQNQPVFFDIGPEKVCGGLDVLFQGYEDLWPLLDELADLHHCLANLMPAPKGFNGYSIPGSGMEHDGKGNFREDNDFPDLYYDRAEQNPRLRKYYDWIQNHQEAYCLDCFTTYHSPWANGSANKLLDLKNQAEIRLYKKAITDAIVCLYTRASQLYAKVAGNR